MELRSWCLRFDRQLDRSLKVVGQRRFKSLPLAGARMTKAKLPRVQHLARKIFCRPRGINFIAEHGMTEMMKMYANLMSASAVQPAFD